MTARTLQFACMVRLSLKVLSHLPGVSYERATTVFKFFWYLSSSALVLTSFNKFKKISMHPNAAECKRG